MKVAPSSDRFVTWQGCSVMSGNMKRPKTTPREPVGGG
jgi:hypothetical protein